MTVVILGSVNMDIVLRVPTIPAPGETITASTRSLYPGGKGANQAVAAARMGADVRFLGAVGDDIYGRELKERLASEGIDTTHLQILPEAETGQAYICVSDAGENNIVVLSGANHDFRLDVESDVFGMEGAVYLAQCEMPLAEIQSFLHRARNGKRILNVAPASDGTQALLDDVDIIVVNEVELSGLSKRNLTGVSPIEGVLQAGRSLIGKHDQQVVVTLGARGACAIGASAAIIVEGTRAEVVDTTGAGDCFCGVLAARLARGDDMAEALSLASAAAAIAVTRPGAGSSMPYGEELANIPDRPRSTSVFEHT